MGLLLRGVRFAVRDQSCPLERCLSSEFWYMFMRILGFNTYASLSEMEGKYIS
jgi:hypothetical protein